MIFLAHEMSQFSDKDVVVFSNCDSIRLSIYDGTKTWTKPVVHAKGHLPNAPVVFENVWDFWEARGYSYTQKNWQKVNMVAEGIYRWESSMYTKENAFPPVYQTSLVCRYSKSKSGSGWVGFHSGSCRSNG